MHAWILYEEKEGNKIYMNINEQTVSRNLNRTASDGKLGAGLGTRLHGSCNALKVIDRVPAWAWSVYYTRKYTIFRILTAIL